MSEAGRTGETAAVRAAADAAGPERPVREPLVRAPWPAVLIAASILAVFALQAATGDVDAWNERFGLHPADLAQGRLLGLVTALWCHANWAHAGANAAFALAFGAPAARLFGPGPRGASVFFAFYLLGGVIASLGFAAVHRGDDTVLVGASGAVSALAGAAARLIGAAGSGAPRTLAPFRSAGVIGMSFAFVSTNLVLGLAGVDLGQGDAPLAWEAHLGGYAAGLLLVGPFLRLAGGARRRAAPEDAAPGD
jgi:membrane associated rhomboid family serine protease